MAPFFMKKKILKFSKRPFVKNIAIVATGTIAVQAIGIVSSPFITRIYGPIAYGLLGVFVALTSIITPVATLTYVTAIILPAQKKAAIGVARLSLFLGVVITVIFTIIITVFKDTIVLIFQLQDIEPYIFFIPIVIFFGAITQVYNQWLIRENQYKDIARTSIIQSLIVNVLKIGVGIFHATAGILIFIVSLGQILYAQLFKSVTSQEVRQELKLKIIFSRKVSQDHVSLGKKFQDFPLYRAPQVLLNGFAKGIPILMLAHFFGPAAAGFYSIGNRVLQMPAGIIGKSIGNVYYPRIARAANNEENLKPYILKATLGMAWLAFVPFVTIVILGPWLFKIIFGSDWATAGHYSRWLSFLVFFEFILHPSKDAIIVMGDQKYLLLFEVISLLFKTGALFFGLLYLNSDLSAIIVFSFTGVLLSILLMILTYYRG